MLAAAALNPQVGALLIRIREFELRVEQLVAADRNICRATVAAPDANALASQVDAKRGEALAARRTAVDNL